MKLRNPISNTRSGKFLALIALAMAAVQSVASAAPFTWNGGGTDTNWNTGLNWGGTAPSATGSDLIFDTSNKLTNINNIVTSANSITYNASAGQFVSTATSPVSILTLAGNLSDNSTSTETLNMPIAISGARTVTVASGGKMVFGSLTGAYAHSIAYVNGTVTFTGANGTVEYLTSSTGSLTLNPTNTGGVMNVDASGLGTFNVNAGTFNVNAANGTTNSSQQNLKLAATANNIYANTITVGTKKGKAAITATSGTVTIRGYGGTTSDKANITAGYYDTNPGAYNPSGSLDFTGATLNATLGTVVLGQNVPNGGVTTTLTTSGSLTVDGSTGTVTADTVRLGWTSGGTVSGSANMTAQGTLTIKNGTTTLSGSSGAAGTGLFIGQADVGQTGTTRSIGTVAISGGTLNVYKNFIIGDKTAGSADAANVRGTLTITGTATVNANVAITTLNAQSTLTLNGGTLDMKNNAIGTGTQIIGSNGGALNWQSGTLKNVASINGTAGLTKTTTGTLTLEGTNGWTGITEVTDGTLKYGVNNAISTGGVTLSSGTLDMVSYTDSIGVFTLTSGTLKMAANQTGIAQLTSTGAVALGTTNNLDLTGMATGAGLYKLVAGTSLTGSFLSANVTGLDSAYTLQYGANELDAQHKATIALALGSNASNVHVGSQTVNLSIGNAAPTGSADLSYTLGGVTGSGTRTAGAGSSAATGTYTAVVGANSFNITASDSNASNSPQTVAFSQTGYSGQMVWSGGTGTYATGGSWTDSTIGGAQMAPGLDLAYQTVDTATFSGAGGIVSLGGSSPSLNAITFNNSGSYTIDQNTSGGITLAGASPTITSAGTHAISAPLTLTSSLTTTVSNLGDSLTLSGGIGQSSAGMGLTKNGLGTLTLSGLNTYSGLTNITGGTLLVDGLITGGGGVTVGVDGTLGGSGAITGPVIVDGILSPGASIEHLTSGGTLTFNNGSIYDFEMNSSLQGTTGVADLMTVIGNPIMYTPTLNLLGTVYLNLSDLAEPDFKFTVPTTLSLIQYVGQWNNGYFTYDAPGTEPDVLLTEGKQFTAGLNTWTIHYGATTGGMNFANPLYGSQFITLTSGNGSFTSIPEPGSLLALGCLVASGAFLRNRRRR